MIFLLAIHQDLHQSVVFYVKIFFSAVYFILLVKKMTAHTRAGKLRCFKNHSRLANSKSKGQVPMNSLSLV